MPQIKQSRWSTFGLVGLALACGAASVLGDEDPLKLRDRQKPFVGPVVRGAAAARLASGSPEDTFPSRNIELRAWLPLSVFPGGPHSDAADCWGYVSPSGREYAIIGLHRGTAFVDVTDPSNPVQAGYIAGPNSLWHDVQVHGHYAYAVSEGGGGIQVIDLAQIDSHIVTEIPHTQIPGHSNTHSTVLDSASGYLYLCGTSLGGLKAVSTANPAAPTLAGTWNNGHYVHECLPVTYTSGPYAGKEIVFCFTAGNGLEIIDATNKASMVKIGGISYSSVTYSHQGWLNEDMKTLYLDDELDGLMLTRIIDVSDLTAPVEKPGYSNGTTSIDHNLYTKGHFIYASNYTTGLRIFDVSNPLQPNEVAYIDTHPENNAASFNGSWGNFAYFPSGTIVISDLERGLFVVDAFCYADCDHSNAMDINDFICFQTKFALGDSYADCDGNGSLNIADFTCFQTKFATAGVCP